jgi:hypothetical protein
MPNIPPAVWKDSYISVAEENHFGILPELTHSWRQKFGVLDSDGLAADIGPQDPELPVKLEDEEADSSTIKRRVRSGTGALSSSLKPPKPKRRK